MHARGQFFEGWFGTIISGIGRVWRKRFVKILSGLIEGASES
jgi:hypothetical protein